MSVCPKDFHLSQILNELELSPDSLEGLSSFFFLWNVTLNFNICTSSMSHEASVGLVLPLFLDKNRSDQLREYWYSCYSCCLQHLLNQFYWRYLKIALGSPPLAPQYLTGLFVSTPRQRGHKTGKIGRRRIIWKENIHETSIFCHTEETFGDIYVQFVHYRVCLNWTKH